MTSADLIAHRIEKRLDEHAECIKILYVDAKTQLQNIEAQRDEMIKWHETMLKQKVIWKSLHDRTSERFEKVEMLQAAVQNLNDENEKLRAQNDAIRAEIANLRIVIPPCDD